MRRVERPEPKERPVGKRVTAQGGSSSGDHIQLGMRVGPRIEPPPKPVQQLPASSYGAPGTKPFGGLADDPGASRPPLARGFTAAATSQQGPVPLEPVIPRLRKVSPEQYYGTGAAGDMSQSFAPAKRPEDLNPKFYNTLKESPTFLRFVASLPPKPQVSPHQRHAAAARRQRVEEVAAEKKLVASLAGLAD